MVCGGSSGYSRVSEGHGDGRGGCCAGDHESPLSTDVFVLSIWAGLILEIP